MSRYGLSSWIRGFALAAGLLGLAAMAACAKDPPSNGGAAKDSKAVKDAKDEAAAEKALATKFIRVERDKKKRPIEMQTAIVRYAKPGAGPKDPYVELVAAVHVGDKPYYRQLNKQFEQYDALLYELVAPKDTRVPKEGKKKSSHPVGILQQGMTEVLDLAFQLDEIDYHKDNFVHADMSPADFSKSMADRGESVWSMMFRAMGYSLAQQNKESQEGMEVQLLAALFDSNRALALKRLMATQFEDLEGAMGIFEGPDGSTIITERNKVALKVLGEQLSAGKKHLGIFYGAGHLPDMEKRLAADFGMKPQSVRWLTAWDMSQD